MMSHEERRLRNPQMNISRKFRHMSMPMLGVLVGRNISREQWSREEFMPSRIAKSLRK